MIDSLPFVELFVLELMFFCSANTRLCMIERRKDLFMCWILELFHFAVVNSVDFLIAHKCIVFSM